MHGGGYARRIHIQHGPGGLLSRCRNPGFRPRKCGPCDATAGVQIPPASVTKAAIVPADSPSEGTGASHRVSLPCPVVPKSGLDVMGAIAARMTIGSVEHSKERLHRWYCLSSVSFEGRIPLILSSRSFFCSRRNQFSKYSIIHDGSIRDSISSNGVVRAFAKPAQTFNTSELTRKPGPTGFTWCVIRLDNLTRSRLKALAPSSS
jgi:hypothetical protein